MRILLVDDDPSALEALQRLLECELDEVVVTTAESGREAMALASGQEFDLVVTDMRMPAMDGAQLLQRFHELHPNTVRVVLSGHLAGAGAGRACPRAHLVLPKPSSRAQLLDTVARARTFRSLLTERG